MLSATVGIQSCLTGAALSPQSPWASLAAGAVLLCWVRGERTSSLYSFKEWEGEGRKREPVSEWPPALPAPGL